MTGIGEAVAGTVAGEAAKSLWAKIKKKVRYIYQYRDNLNALEEADAQLAAKMGDERKFSGETSRSVRDVSATVVNWRSDAEVLHQEAAKLTQQNNISCLKPWSRYSTSRRASKLTPNIKEKVKALDFGKSFDIPIAEGARFNLRDYMEFESRRTIPDDVLKALRNIDVRMCSICGMGGIGKTMMAKKIVQIVEADHLFDKVAMVSVSQNPNLEKIQEEIIDSLQLKIDESTSMQGRAKKLNYWLSNNKSLLVLDDVWWQLHDEDFEKVGIPLGNSLCKIFVTSRNIRECEQMGSQPNIPFKDLEQGEAWELFIQNAGNFAKDFGLRETARKIVDECGGLPIAILTIATALKDKPQGAWNIDSLKKLTMSNLQGIPEMEKVYSKIKVSYDLLEDPEAKSCLQLCSLFPEDYDVPVEKFVFYGWCLELFKGVDSLKEARHRVASIVHQLKNTFLFLDSEKNGHVKLHNIVCNFLIWISSKDEYPYLVRCENEMGKWPETFQCEMSGAISFVCQQIKNHQVGLRCPNLKLLHLHSNYGSNTLPNGFFDGMEEVRVVDVDAPSKLPPLTKQKALRTLLISHDSNEMVPLSGCGCMKNLEIFSLSSRLSLFEFPKEIGMMHNLRFLRFIVASLKYMPQGVLSKLDQLEELELPLSFNDWGILKEGRTNASLDDIAFLPLTSITIALNKGSILPENIVKRITSFRICIESPEYKFDSFDSNVLVVRKVDACDALVKWTRCLLSKCHRLELESVDLKYIMSQQLRENNCYQTECFSQLTTLRIEGMNSLEEIVSGIYLSNRQQPCFTNLTTIGIENCPKLKCAFPLSVALEFTQLQSMTLSNCREMEAVFYNDQGDSGNQDMEERIESADEREVDPTDVMPRLKLLHLYIMPELRAVYNGNHAIGCRSLQELKFIMCNDMEGLFYQSGTLKLDDMKVHLKNISKWLPFARENEIQKIKRLKIARCHEMKYLADAVSGPTFLTTFFSNLEELTVKYMDSLEEIWHGSYRSKIHAQCFSNLIKLIIYECPKMKHFFPLAVASELRQLQVMKIESCEEIKEIFHKNSQVVEKSSICCPTPTSFIQCLLSHQRTEENIQKIDPVIVFPQLKVLSLRWMPELRVMYDGNHTIECPSLEELTIRDCSNMEGLSYGSFSAPEIKKLVLKGVRNVKNIPQLLHLEQDSGFIPCVITLSISDCREMIYLVDAMTDRNLLKTLFRNLEHFGIEGMGSLEKIWHGPDHLSIIPPQTFFSHLTFMVISECPKLKHVFPLSVATEFTQLQDFRIEKCEGMVEIFYKDQVADRNQNASSVELNSPTTGTASAPPYSYISTHQSTEENIQKVDEIGVDLPIIFPQLKVLLLRDMPELRVLYNGNHTIECPSLKQLTIDECNNMEGLSYGSFTATKSKKLELRRVRHLKNIAEWLHLEQDGAIPQLQELQIESCHEMIYLVDAMTDRNLSKTLFCNLEHLHMEGMDSLEEMWHGTYLSNVQRQTCFDHLTRIIITGCPKLKHVFTLSVATELTQLRQLEIRWCGEMEEIFCNDQVDNGNQIMEENTTEPDQNEVEYATTDTVVIFQQLKVVKLSELSKLRIFYDGNHAIELPSLEYLDISECKEIRALSNGSFKAPRIKNLWINATTEYSSMEDLNTLLRKTLNINKEEEKDKDGDKKISITLN